MSNEQTPTKLVMEGTADPEVVDALVAMASHVGLRVYCPLELPPGTAAVINTGETAVQREPDWITLGHFLTFADKTDQRPLAQRAWNRLSLRRDDGLLHFDGPPIPVKGYAVQRPRDLDFHTLEDFVAAIDHDIASGIPREMVLRSYFGRGVGRNVTEFLRAFVEDRQREQSAKGDQPR